jgi:hypothetical protein
MRIKTLRLYKTDSALLLQGKLSDYIVSRFMKDFVRHDLNKWLIHSKFDATAVSVAAIVAENAEMLAYSKSLDDALEDALFENTEHNYDLPFAASTE